MTKTYEIKIETISRRIGLARASSVEKTITTYTVLENGISIAITKDAAEAEEIRAYYAAAEEERQVLISELGEDGYFRLIDENTAG